MTTPEEIQAWLLNKYWSAELIKTEEEKQAAIREIDKLMLIPEEEFSAENHDPRRISPTHRTS